MLATQMPDQKCRSSPRCSRRADCLGGSLAPTQPSRVHGALLSTVEATTSPRALMLLDGDERLEIRDQRVVFASGVEMVRSSMCGPAVQSAPQDLSTTTKLLFSNGRPRR